MDHGYSPNVERFQRDQVGQPYLLAVQELCARTGKTLDDMERLTLQEISELADAIYSEGLPPFWKTWKDWHADDFIQPMGDLDR